MRKLTINRKKSFVASLVRIFIYLETKEEEATTNKDKLIKIVDTTYKQVGTIANGKALTIEIPEETTKIMIAYSNNFPAQYNIRHTIPEGKEDIILNTRPKLSPLKGNPFIIEQ